MSPTEYVRTLLEELERVRPRNNYDLSHAIALQNGRLCVLLSLGDFRARFYLEDLDPDPVKAADAVGAKWRDLKDRPVEIEFDG